jgi:uncharacterized membrane protein
VRLNEMDDGPQRQRPKEKIGAVIAGIRDTFWQRSRIHVHITSKLTVPKASECAHEILAEYQFADLTVVDSLSLSSRLFYLFHFLPVD